MLIYHLSTYEIMQVLYVENSFGCADLWYSGIDTQREIEREQAIEDIKEPHSIRHSSHNFVNTTFHRNQ